MNCRGRRGLRRQQTLKRRFNDGLVFGKKGRLRHLCRDKVQRWKLGDGLTAIVNRLHSSRKAPLEFSHRPFSAEFRRVLPLPPVVSGNRATVSRPLRKVSWLRRATGPSIPAVSQLLPVASAIFRTRLCAAARAFYWAQDSSRLSPAWESSSTLQSMQPTPNRSPIYIKHNHSRKFIFESALWRGHLVTIAAGMASPIVFTSAHVALATRAEGNFMPVIFDSDQ